MSLPSFCDDFRIFFNDRLDDSYLLFLESVIVYLFYRRYIVFGFTIVFDNVYVNRLMV